MVNHLTFEGRFVKKIKILRGKGIIMINSILVKKKICTFIFSLYMHNLSSLCETRSLKYINLLLHNKLHSF